MCYDANHKYGVLLANTQVFLVFIRDEMVVVFDLKRKVAETTKKDWHLSARTFKISCAVFL